MMWSTPFERREKKKTRRKSHPLKTLQAQRRLEAKKEAQERRKEAQKEAKLLKKIKALELREKKNIAIAKERESVIRRRKATAKSKAAHPLVRLLAPKSKKRRKKAWWG